MGTKRKSLKSKRSLSSLPKGLVHGSGKRQPNSVNPFETIGGQRQQRQKFHVHNKPISKPKATKHVLEKLKKRQVSLKSTLSVKANVFVDKRIGQYDPTMSKDDRMMARLVKERTRQSQRNSKYRLDDDDGDGDDDGGNTMFLTHKGGRLDPKNMEAIYSDDEDGDNGNLEAVDTELHFGGAALARSRSSNPYGGSTRADLQQVYSQRKTDLDDLIARRKVKKAERMQAKEAQVETVEQMDATFGELSQLLSYRKDEERLGKKKATTGTTTKEDEEMNQWNRELKQMMMKPKRKATDRTKTPEEIAKEEAERLHELETRRMARMNGDFEQDDFSDISSVDDNDYSRKKKKKMNRNTKGKEESNHRKPEELTDSEDDDQDDPNELQARFTADGLVYVDKDGNVVKRKEETSDSDSDLESESGDEKDGDKIGLQSKGGGDHHHPLLAKGTRVQGNYHAAEQFDSQDAWYDGVISRVHEQPDGSVKYDVDYDDGDFEENMLPEYVRPIEKTKEEKKILEEKTEKELEIQFKRNKARDKARYVLLKKKNNIFLLFLVFLGVFWGSPFLCRTWFCFIVNSLP